MSLLPITPPPPSAQHQLTWLEVYNLIDAMPADRFCEKHNIPPLYNMLKAHTWAAVHLHLDKHRQMLPGLSPIYLSDLAEPEKQLYYRIKHGIDISPEILPTIHKPYLYIGACWLFLTGIFIWLSGTFNASHWSINAKCSYLGLTCLLMLCLFFANTIFAPTKKQ